MSPIHLEEGGSRLVFLAFWNGLVFDLRVYLVFYRKFNSTLHLFLPDVTID